MLDMYRSNSGGYVVLMLKVDAVMPIIENNRILLLYRSPSFELRVRSSAKWRAEGAVDPRNSSDPVQ
jgi:hypothetical protein